MYNGVKREDSSMRIGAMDNNTMYCSNHGKSYCTPIAL